MSLRSTVFCALFAVPFVVTAQDRPPAVPAAKPPARVPTPNDTLVSPEVSADRQITFRLYAPKAEQVRLAAEFKDANKLELSKAENGVWSGTAMVDAGTYRYTFTVDGVRTNDPKNPMISESVGNTSSVVCSAWVALRLVETGGASVGSARSTASGSFTSGTVAVESAGNLKPRATSHTASVHPWRRACSTSSRSASSGSTVWTQMPLNAALM